MATVERRQGYGADRPADTGIVLSPAGPEMHPHRAAMRAGSRRRAPRHPHRNYHAEQRQLEPPQPAAAHPDAPRPRARVEQVERERAEQLHWHRFYDAAAWEVE